MSDVIDRDELIQPLDILSRTAAQPDAGARGAEPGIYTSQALFELEQERLFAHEWACVGRADELARPGDYMTTTIGRTPVLIVRRDDGTLGAMLNICSHRLAGVASGRGNALRFACPYHGWSYGRDGSLLFAGRMPEDFDKASCNLKQARLETWNGFVYVNLDPQAPSIEEKLAPLTTLFRNYRLGEMRTMHKATEVWNANWKVATENFLESYHLEVVHAASIGGLAPPETLRMAEESPWYAFHRVELPDEAVQPVEGSLQTDNPDISLAERKTIFAGGVFPNHLFTVQHDQITWMRTQPISVDRTLIEWGVAGAYDWPEGETPDPENPEFYYLREMPQVNDEDRAIVEAVQIGATSGLVAPARLHPVEHGLLTFARYLDARLRGPENAF